MSNTDEIVGTATTELAEEAGLETELNEGLSKKEILHNMKCCVTLDAVWTTGWTDFQIALRPLLVYLGATDLRIGFIMGLTWLTWIGLPLSPWISSRFPYKKWYYYIANIPYTAPLGIIGLVVVMSHSLAVSNAWLLMFVTWSLVAHQFFAGFVALPAQEYIAGCIPMNYRGRYNGLSNSIGSLLSIFSTMAGGAILYKCQKPMSFGYLFMITWFICQSGYTFALFAVERPVKTKAQPRAWSKEMIRAAWDDKPWLRVLLTFTTVGLLFGSVTTYIDIYSYRVLKMGAVNAAGYQMTQLIVRLAVSALAGFLVDKYGPRRILPVWPFVHITSLVIVLLWPSPFGIYLSQFIGSILFMIFVPALAVAMYSLPKPENRTGHYTIQLMLQQASAALGGIWAGYLCGRVGYHNAFVLTTIGVILSLPVILWAVAPLRRMEQSKAA